MQSTFNLKSAIAFTIGVVFVFVGSTHAQEAVKKKTVEPVFRVPKLKRAHQTPDAEPFRQTAPATRAAKSVIERPINNTPQVVAPTPVPVQRSSNLPLVDPPVARVADAGEILGARDKKLDEIIPENLITNAVNTHPLDRAIEVARDGLDGIRQNVADYTAILVKRERVDDRLSEPNYMRIKIRNPRVVGNTKTPFSIYMKFIKPRASAGREVIWVEGQNNNNLIAHETGALLRFRNFHLEPNGFLAMKGNKYPIYDAGLENLVLKLIDKAERDRAAGACEVRYTEDAQINKRPCSLIEVTHKECRQPYEFHMAKVYIDKQLNLPVRFVSYDWPVAGGRPKVIEEYTYINIQTNVGLTDADFDIRNPAYNFAR